MLSKKRMVVYFLFTMAMALALALGGTQLAGSYPPAGSGYVGWTAEATAPDAYWGYHVQMAYAGAGSYMYMVAEAPGGGEVKLWRTCDTDNLAWEYVCRMEYPPATEAHDPYIDAEGQYVAISWKEWNGSRWGQAIALSADYGINWTKHFDGNTLWNNYEAHVDICDGKLHCAYVSDYDAGQGFRNEVYYKRFNLGLDLGLDLEVCSCASGQLDGVAASQPCIEATWATFCNVYYQYGNAAPHPIYESYTVDGGVNWSITGEKIPTYGVFEMNWPEVAVFYEGGDRRKLLVADGYNWGTGYRQIRYARYQGGSWDTVAALQDLGMDCSYPQIATRGNDILIFFRGSGSAGNEGQARINLSSGDGNWSFIDNLFYENMPGDHTGCVDCCTDGTRFYAAQCGRGDHVEVMTKREDTVDPTVSINDPGTYQGGDFTVTATARDDFNKSYPWFLSPVSENYNNGITHASFYYKPSGAGGWVHYQDVGDAPFSISFPGAGIAEGSYDFRVVVTDTAERVSEATLGGIIVDRTPPSVDLNVSGPDGANGWFMNQPSFGPQVAAQDTLSGVKACYFKFDDQHDWKVFSQPFSLLEGEHVIHYYAEDEAGNLKLAKDYPYKADFSDPSGAITAPANDSYVTTELSVDVDAGDGLSGVDRVEFYVEDALFASDDTAPYSGSTNLSSLTDGQKIIKARVYDRAGRWAWTDQVLVNKDTTPPTVEVIEPTGEQWIRGMVAVKADIRDNMQVGRAVFHVDGEVVDERTSAPWMAAWDTSTVVNGYHALRVEAWDAAGNRADVTAAGEVTIYVGNNISETNNFAEGCTRPGFDTWLCLQNPGDEPADVTVNYYLGEGQGAASARTYALPAHSRSTVYVNGDVGAGKDVSIQVTSSKPIVSERPMYFDYQGTSALNWKGCHTAQGAHFPRQDWYFAEGCTRPGFDTWLCLQNPEGRAAEVEVEYMMEKGARMVRRYRVDAWSRDTILVNREVGRGHDVSMRVFSETPIVAERPVYFLYQGMWDGGHNVMGAAQPEREWYFAEGCTRTGFNQWICLMNPNPEATTACIDYVMEDGGRIERQYGLAPHSRHTVNVNNDVARQHDVSCHISSQLPIVVERPMYFLYHSAIDEGSNAMGVCRPGSSWYLAEGCTRAGFEEWICLMNPGEEGARVALRFMLEDTSQREHAVDVPPGTRVTVKVNDVVGQGHDVSVEVMSDRPVIVERPMYSTYRGSCPSGDTLSGYTFNP